MVRLKAYVDCAVCGEGEKFLRKATDGHIVAQCAECDSITTHPEQLSTDCTMDFRWSDCTDASEPEVLASAWAQHFRSHHRSIDPWE